MKKLNPKQTLFVKYYVSSMNVTKAYRKAYGSGLSDNSCAVSGKKLLNQPKIKQEVDREIERVKGSIEIDTDYVVKGFVEIHRLGIETGNLSAANKSLECLGKFLGMFKEKVEVNADVISTNELSLSISEIDQRIKEITSQGKDTDIKAPL